MHEAGALPWREVIDKHHASLMSELTESFASELSAAVGSAISEEHSKAGPRLREACDKARVTEVESLNQLLRRLRAAVEDDVLSLVAKSAASYAAQVVVLVFESNQSRLVLKYGFDETANDEVDEVVAFDTTTARAVTEAIDTLDHVIALASPAEISPLLAGMLNPESRPDRKAYLFPVVARQSVLAMLIAAGVQLSAPIELLCEAAGMRLESSRLESPRAAAGATVHEPRLAKVQDVPASATSAARSWNDLSTEDQKLHLQAQRMARVKVAELRLYHQSDLQAGVTAGNIYGSLQANIDNARDRFLQTFLSKSPTMVDYLHLEILRSLAHDDDRLLGHNYPGPMV